MIFSNSTTEPVAARRLSGRSLINFRDPSVTQEYAIGVMRAALQRFPDVARFSNVPQPFRIQYIPELNIGAVALPPELVRVALRDEHVDINSERVVSAALLTPGADDDATDAYSPFAQLGVDTTSYTGKDVTIALLDSGTPTHADLTGAFADESNFTLYENLNEDNYGHATHCAGLMVGPRASGGYGVAPEAKVLYGRVLDRNGDGLDMSVISGIVWAIRKKAKIIVMCLGSPVPPYSTPDIYYRKAAAAATGKGILLLAAAGNKIIGSNAPVHHPANCLEIPAVGAVLRNLQPAPFSCVYEPEGDTVEMVTPGELLRSSWLNNSYRRYSGTSMSCALAAGLGALWIQQGSANPLNDLITHVINGVVQAP